MAQSPNALDLQQLKPRLHALCQQFITQRIDTAREAMNAAQAAANNEGKSSAGDKYETGRAMMQLERDQHARLLAEALKLKQALDGLDPAKCNERAMAGSLVCTSQGNFYLSVSLGKLVLDGQEWMAISPATPMAASLLGKQVGETAKFLQKNLEILSLF